MFQMDRSRKPTRRTASAPAWLYISSRMVGGSEEGGKACSSGAVSERKRRGSWAES